MITMRIVWVLDVKKVGNELSGPFVKFGAPQAHNESSNPPEICHKRKGNKETIFCNNRNIHFGRIKSIKLLVFQANDVGIWVDISKI